MTQQQIKVQKSSRRPAPADTDRRSPSGRIRWAN